jgi:transposase, IS5 family
LQISHHTSAEITLQINGLRVFQGGLDKGYKGAVVDGVEILRSGQRRGVTRTMKAMIKRRSAIEPTIGHMKSDGRLDRNPLKGALGDALHAVLCGAGHNIRLLLSLLRLFTAYLLAAILAWVDRPVGERYHKTPLAAP